MPRIPGGLPDYLALGLSILFVGINPGFRSSEVGHHFAGPSNRFWKLLFDAGLVPHRLTYLDDSRLLDYGYGLTNLIARPTASIQDLGKLDFLEGREVLRGKIGKYQPALVAILGISVARILWISAKTTGSFSSCVTKYPMQTGLQTTDLAGAPVFVLPNPSGRNAYYSYQTMRELFVELRSISLSL